MGNAGNASCHVLVACIAPAADAAVIFVEAGEMLPRLQLQQTPCRIEFDGEKEEPSPDHVSLIIDEEDDDMPESAVVFQRESAAPQNCSVPFGLKHHHSPIDVTGVNANVNAVSDANVSVTHTSHLHYESFGDEHGASPLPLTPGNNSSFPRHAFHFNVSVSGTVDSGNSPSSANVTPRKSIEEMLSLGGHCGSNSSSNSRSEDTREGSVAEIVLRPFVRQFSLN